MKTEELLKAKDEILKQKDEELENCGKVKETLQVVIVNVVVVNLERE
ncbi:hypothetical protein A2U01_0044963 [Trifolium medium]|uniref:Uncharacterized protein n=1 Tax=Trifolium medium TaxID=97028 RepID=A0A392QHA5_9FABA|nr:hypothetical protein [Trifolium medium]